MWEISVREICVPLYRYSKHLYTYTNNTGCDQRSGLDANTSATAQEALRTLLAASDELAGQDSNIAASQANLRAILANLTSEAESREENATGQISADLASSIAGILDVLHNQVDAFRVEEINLKSNAGRASRLNRN